MTKLSVIKGGRSEEKKDSVLIPTSVGVTALDLVKGNTSEIMNEVSDEVSAVLNDGEVDKVSEFILELKECVTIPFGFEPFFEKQKKEMNVQWLSLINSGIDADEVFKSALIKCKKHWDVKYTMPMKPLVSEFMKFLLVEITEGIRDL